MRMKLHQRHLFLLWITVSISFTYCTETQASSTTSQPSASDSGDRDLEIEHLEIDSDLNWLENGVESVQLQNLTEQQLQLLDDLQMEDGFLDDFSVESFEGTDQISNNTQAELLPQPEALVSRVQNFLKRQEHDQRVIRYKLRNMIIPSKKHRIQQKHKKAPPRKGGAAHRQHHGHKHQRKDDHKHRPKPPQQKDEVIGHQVPPLSIYPIPSEEEQNRRIDNIQEVIESRPAPKPFLIRVPGEGVIKLPPPPSHIHGDQHSPVFPPPFPIGAVPPASRPAGKQVKNAGRSPRPAGKQAGKKRRRPPHHRNPRPRRPGFRHHHQKEATSDVDGYHVYVFDEDEANQNLENFIQPQYIGPDANTGINSAVKTTAFPFKPDVFELSNFERLIPQSGGGRKKPPGRPAPPVESTRQRVKQFKPRNQCSHFTETICLDSDFYPYDEIARSLATGSTVADTIFAEVPSQSADTLVDGVSSMQEETYDYTHYFGTRRQDSSVLPTKQSQQSGVAAHSHRDFAEEGGYLCPSEVKYARPKKAQNSQGEWKFIVNMEHYTQTLRMEKCMRPGASCSYVSHHYKSHCSQVFNFHRLLSWDKKKGLHMDIFKVPVACSCHIQGYSYIYPPLETHGISFQEASNHEEKVAQPDLPRESINTRIKQRRRRPTSPRVVTAAVPVTTQTSPVRRFDQGITHSAAPNPDDVEQESEDVFSQEHDVPSETLDEDYVEITSTTARPRVTTRRRKYRNRVRHNRRPESKLSIRRRIKNRTEEVGDAVMKEDENGTLDVRNESSSFGARIDDDGGNYKRGIYSAQDNEFQSSNIELEVRPLPETVDSGTQRDKINYAYHPIIDFFDNS